MSNAIIFSVLQHDPEKCLDFISKFSLEKFNESSIEKNTTEKILSSEQIDIQCGNSLSDNNNIESSSISNSNLIATRDSNENDIDGTTDFSNNSLNDTSKFRFY